MRLRPGTKVVGRPLSAVSIARVAGERGVGNGGERVELDQVVVAEPRPPVGIERRQVLADARAQFELDGMALAVVEADGLHAGEARQRPGQADGGILPAGEQHEGGVVGEGHAGVI